MNHAAFGLLGLFLIVAVGETLAAGVPLWQPHDLEFISDASHENPYMVRFEAIATGPSGETIRIPGFHDGNKVWKIRFSPTLKGKWTIKTSSSDPKLDEQTAIVECTGKPQPNGHGPLKIDPAHPRHFIYEDGRRFFLMGYECDWLWVLDTSKPELPTINRFLKKLSSSGFNYVLLNVYAHDTSWRKGHTEPGDYGPPSVFPWAGTNERPDHSRLNPAFWQHYDRVIDAMLKHGIIAHIMIKVYNKDVNWPERLSREDDLYFHTLLARYSAYPNVVWDFSKESYKEKSQDYKINRIKFIRANDPYQRLLTMHDDDHAYENNVHGDRLGYRSDQNHRDWHKTILKQRAQKEWPVVNVEFGYEWGPGGKDDATYPVCQSPEEVVRRAWEIYMAGGYGAYYYTRTAWDVIYPADNPPGYRYFSNLRNFFANTKYWLLEPRTDLVDKGYCLALPGNEYVVCLMEPGQVKLTLEGIKSPLSAEWFNPLTGEKKAAGKLGNGQRKLTVPSSWGAISVLHVH